MEPFSSFGSIVLTVLAASGIAAQVVGPFARDPQLPGQLENPIEKPDLPPDSPPVPTPGPDRCMGLSWEPTIAVDPNNPQVVAIGQGQTVRISLDGGNTFLPALTATIPGPVGADPGWCAGGDPSLAFDSQGNLFITTLGTRCNATQVCGSSSPCTVSNGRDVFLHGWQRVGNSFLPLVSAQNVTALSNHGAPHNADKPWIAADSFAGSPLETDNLYVAWADLDQFPFEIWTSVSPDQGITWSTAQRLSAASEGAIVWGTHVTVAPNHDVYVGYHAQKNFFVGAPAYDVPDGVSGRVMLYRSRNGGVLWTQTATNPFDADDATFSECAMTWNVQHYANGVIPNASYWLFGSVQPWVLADPSQTGRLYVVCNDDPDDDIDVGDAADVVIVRSDDFGATWSDPIRVDDAPGTTFTVMPTAAIDPVSGAIAVTWYDSRSGVQGTSGDLLLDLRASTSLNGGLSWLPSVDVNDGTFDPGLSNACRYCCTAGSCQPGSPQTLRIGEYNGVAFGECTAHMVWADTETCGTGGFSDTYYDRDPELGGDLTPPTLVCPADVSLGCNDPTDPGATGSATATDLCDANPIVRWVDEILPGNCPPSTVLFSIRRIWNATDAASNIATCEQIITVTDFDPPKILLPPDLVIFGSGCGTSSGSPSVQNWIAQASADDECSQATLLYDLPALFPADCGGRTTDVIFTGQDECGNADFAVGSVTVNVGLGSGLRFCFGDGTGTPCPCANNGLPGHGCEIAQGTGGVCLTAQSFAPDGAGGGSVDFLGTNFAMGALPLCLVLRSKNLSGGMSGVAFGDGLLCLGSPIKRRGSAQAQDGCVTIHEVHTAGPGRHHYQLWFRNNPPAYCNPALAFSTSNAVTLDW